MIRRSPRGLTTFGTIAQYKKTNTKANNKKIFKTNYGISKDKYKRNKIRKERETMKKLEYVDLKQAITTLEESISQAETALQINQLVLEKFNSEIKKLQPPILSKKKE